MEAVGLNALEGSLVLSWLSILKLDSVYFCVLKIFLKKFKFFYFFFASI
jgi:hypothetical protein